MAQYKKIIPLALLATFITLSSNLKSVYSSGSESIDKRINEIEKATLTNVDKRKDTSNTFLKSFYKLAVNAFETDSTTIEGKLTEENEVTAEKSGIENTAVKELKNASKEIKTAESNKTKYSKETDNRLTASDSPNYTASTSSKPTTANKSATITRNSAANSNLFNVPNFNLDEISDYTIKNIAQKYLTQIRNENSKDKYIQKLASIDNLDEFLQSMANYKKSSKEEAFDRALNKVIKTKNLESSLIDFYVLKASAWQESRFTSDVVSSAGAVGYFQLTEGTHLNFRPGDTFPQDAKIPEKNISAGIDYYLYLIDYIKENHPRPDTLTDKGIVNLAVAGYNAGQGTFTHYYVKGKDNKKKAILKPENEAWRVEYMPRESREHVKVIIPKIEEFRNRDILIAYAKEYVQRKNQILAQK